MSDIRRDAVKTALYASADSDLYAVLDGASIPALLGRLAEHEPTHTCLFSGTLDPALAPVSPYLVHLEQDSGFSRWLLERCWDEHWGVFATVPAGIVLRDVRKHFRQFLQVRLPNGNLALFRYYDPRVLREHLPECDIAELKAFFGPVTQFILEADAPAQLLSFTIARGELDCTTTTLTRDG